MDFGICVDCSWVLGWVCLRYVWSLCVYDTDVVELIVIVIVVSIIFYYVCYYFDG